MRVIFLACITLVGMQKKTDQNVMLKSGFEQQNYYYQFNLITKVLLFIFLLGHK